MTTHNIGDLVLSPIQIQRGVEKVAYLINKQFKGDPVTAIAVMPSGLFFAADLLRKLKSNVSMDYISIPKNINTANEAEHIAFHNNIDIDHQHVILIDDALEQSDTFERIIGFFNKNYALRSLSIASLFIKPQHCKISVPLYYAYTVTEEELLVGYGLPGHNTMSNIPFISKVANY